MVRAKTALLILSGALLATAQSQPEQKAKEEIVALDQDWITAEVQQDRKALERILDEAFVITYPSGETLSRKEFIDRLLSKPTAPFEAVHEAIHIHGDAAVIVDGLIREPGAVATVKATWVAVRKDGKWRAVAEHFSSIPQASKK